MRLNLSFDAQGRPRIGIGDKDFLLSLDVSLPNAPEGLSAGEWEKRAGQDDWGEFTSWRRLYRRGEDRVLSFTVRVYARAVELEVELLQPLSGLARTDSFADLSLHAPAFSCPEELEFLAVTYGLDRSGAGYPGGYWPTAVLGRGMEELPRQALTPLVLHSGEGALAIAPANWFLTSSLAPVPGGLARGLHGAVDRLPEGFVLSTLVALGDDPFSALRELGRLLRSRGTPRGMEDHPLLTRLGWWNAYGGYYTELVRPLTAEELAKVVEGLQQAGVPLGYLGLDLWYPYQEIGKALRYRADPRKYPQGLQALRERWDLPFVLHLSALAERNEYGVSPGDPAVYRTIARELVEQGGIAAWHDWLRTQQHLTPDLRADPQAAERWFSGMAEAFAEAGLPMLLCMHTMGMVLASTRHGNVISARSYTDFLFSLRAALAEAARRGHGELLEAWIPPGRLRAQNLLMGAVLSAFGLAPFHDLFLSRPHPGLGGERPWEDAVLRALSCGPVGIGDGPGMADVALLRRLAFPDGTVGQPDRPPFPIGRTLNQDIQAFWTERRAGDGRWIYLLLLNTAEEELPFRLDPPVPGDFLIWDGLRNEPTKGVQGRLPPGRLAYFILAPRRAGIAPLGLAGKLVPAPAGRVESAEWNGGWRLRLRAVSGPVAFWSEGPIRVETRGGKRLGLAREGGLRLCQVDGERCELIVRR